jgi:hypothetical protein
VGGVRVGGLRGRLSWSGISICQSVVLHLGCSSPPGRLCVELAQCSDMWDLSGFWMLDSRADLNWNRSAANKGVVVAA